MRIAVTPADREVARLDVALAERLGEDVDPTVRLIAEMDLPASGRSSARPDLLGPRAVWLDDRTGEVVAVSVATGPEGDGGPAG